jgi:hypothetical protein
MTALFAYAASGAAPVAPLPATFFAFFDDFVQSAEKLSFFCCFFTKLLLKFAITFCFKICYNSNIAIANKEITAAI